MFTRRRLANKSMRASGRGEARRRPSLRSGDGSIALDFSKAKVKFRSHYHRADVIALESTYRPAIFDGSCTCWFFFPKVLNFLGESCGCSKQKSNVLKQCEISWLRADEYALPSAEFHEWEKKHPSDQLSRFIMCCGKCCWPVTFPSCNTLWNNLSSLRQECNLSSAPGNVLFRSIIYKCAQGGIERILLSSCDVSIGTTNIMPQRLVRTTDSLFI